MHLKRTDSTRPRMHVAIVHGRDGVHFVAASESRSGLIREVANYVRQQADLQLYPRDVAILTDMLQRGDDEGAVRFYFQRVGQRWDREWLKSELVTVADGRRSWQLVR